MADFKSYKDHSRDNYGNSLEDASTEKLMLGCVQRIADACEAMARNHDSLVRDRDLYKRWYEEEQKRKERLARSNAALRGHIKRMKRICKWNGSPKGKERKS